jgi:hypothetical protein
MSRFTVPIADILGSAFYNYELTSSTYNPTSTISSFTITCEVTNVFGNKVSGKELTLYENEVSKGTATTNANGLATWTVTANDVGVRSFSVANTKCSIKVSGWETVSLGSGVSSYATLYVNKDLRLCELRYVRSFSSAVADTFYSWHTGAIPSDYRPSDQVNGSMNQVGTLYTDSNGDIGGKFANSWSSNRTVKGTVMWHY